MGRLISLDEDVDGKTPLESLDGLLVTIKTRGELNALEFVNISKPTTKYLILKQCGHSLIQWPDKELLKKTGIRERYLKALREADRGIFKPLTDLQNELQRS